MTRIKLTIVNKTGTDVKCTNIKCEKFENLVVGNTVANNGSNEFTSDTNDRIFCTFEQIAPGAGKWELAMTCPKSSSNAACGSLDAGLQKYSESGTPAHFTFNLGNKNLADWDSGDSNDGNVIPYGDC